MCDESRSAITRSTVMGLALALLLSACAKSDKTVTSDTSATATGATPTAGAPATPGAPAAPGGTAGPGPVPGPPPPGATPQMVALGDSIFRGQAAGGTCFTCHGMDAKGTALAPPLVRHKWLTGDGSYAFIQERITKGMPTPTPPYIAAMPPMGGAQLTPDQIKAVAAYVYSISR